jgi:hypothetical protein
MGISLIAEQRELKEARATLRLLETDVLGSLRPGGSRG